MPSQEKLSEFTAWCAQQITGDEKGQAQIFLDRLFQACGHPGVLDVGGTTEFRIRKDREDGGGTAFADLVWKPVVLIEMKKRGTDLQKHYRQAFDYWTRLVPNRPRYVVLCNFDEFRIYDFETQMDSPMDTLALADLPGRWGPLAFLFPGQLKPTFENDFDSDSQGSRSAPTLGWMTWSRWGNQIAPRATSVPPICPDAKKLVTEDCIRPATN